MDWNSQKWESSSYLELDTKIGVNGTPAFIVNGELIPSAVDEEILSQKLKSIYLKYFKT